MWRMHAGREDLERAANALASRLPWPLAPLALVAYNYRWAGFPDGPALFRELDPRRWRLTHHNPVRLLEEVSPEALIRAAADPAYVARAEAIEHQIRDDLLRPFSEGAATEERPVAFFCAEYGIHRCLPTYSGGLGILAGDILKEASDMAVPMVGVGILYRQGIFHQRIDASGWQHEYWIESDPDRLPMALVTGDDGLPLTVRVPLRGRDVTLQVWRVDVGRTPLYLLDAQRPENSLVDRWITARLYVGDRKFRLAQYAVLGTGGMRALRALGIEPSVLHLNEGHAALAPLELAREQVEAGAPLEEALASARSRTVFTTHTPVPAGNETYTAEEIRGVLGEFSDGFHAEEPRVLGLGRSRPDDPSEPFGLTVLGIRVSRSSNAVSRVHGQVTRLMWQHLFPDRPVEEVPIIHVTNGVHVPTWMAPPMRALLDRHLGDGWIERAAEPSTWAPVDGIPDEELWAVRNELRANLGSYVQTRSVADRLARGDPIEYAEAGAKAFDVGVLTVGFARRVAAYKRLHLLVHDHERGVRLFQDPHPIQLALAGKAHPQDEDAKRILQSVFAQRLPSAIAERAVYLEDYEMGMAAQLVSGCDVWLNVPRAPLEASGTSGMKSAVNGGLNVSVLDGWWEEAFDGTNGWGIDADASLEASEGDARDAAALYDLLEGEVVPLFYDRDESGIPRGWIARVKASLRTAGPRYGATRMLQEYVKEVYGVS